MTIARNHEFFAIMTFFAIDYIPKLWLFLCNYDFFHNYFFHNYDFISRSFDCILQLLHFLQLWLYRAIFFYLLFSQLWLYFTIMTLYLAIMTFFTILNLFLQLWFYILRLLLFSAIVTIACNHEFFAIMTFLQLIIFSQITVMTFF